MGCWRGRRGTLYLAGSEIEQGQLSWIANFIPFRGATRRARRSIHTPPTVAEQYLSGGATATGSPPLPPVEVVVHVEATAVAAEPATGGTLDDGTSLAPAATERLLCDAKIVEVLEVPVGTCLTSAAGGARFRRCSGARFACAMEAAGSRGARTGMWTGITSSRGPGVARRRSRTCARSAGGTTPTSTSTASAWSATARVDSGSSGRTGVRWRPPLTGFPRWDGRAPDYEHAVFCLVG